MEIVDATDVEQNMYPVMKSITKSALKANITLEVYNDYINCLDRRKIDTQKVLKNNER